MFLRVVKMVCGRRSTTNETEEEHKRYTRKFNTTNKILLLGTGESGKTTIIKQMRILHINGFSDQERKEKIPFIKQNIHESIYDICFNMDKIDPPVTVENEENQEAVQFILKMGPKEPTEYSVEYFENVKKAWSDPGVKSTFRRSNEYQLIDSAEHFLNKLDDIVRPDYIPTTQDILYCRIMTVSISKIEFEMPVPKKYGGGSAEFWMYDVGGQRGQRKKWIQVFDGIQAVLFLIAASDFDQNLREDASRNRLVESFSLFKDTFRSKYVRQAGLIVFLNKQDLLQRKIQQGRKVGRYFPEFEEFMPERKGDPEFEYERAKLFMREKIMKISETPVIVEDVGYIPGKNITEQLPPRKVFVHFTIATDTNNIKKVFDSVHETILANIITNVLY